jgi:hypothetical protein
LASVPSGLRIITITITIIIIIIIIIIIMSSVICPTESQELATL